MCKKEGECADEEHSHEEKRVVDQGIFFPVAFFRMGIELGEACRGCRMAFSARRKDILLGEHGAWILDPSDGMITMAVSALRHGGITEPGYLAMVCLPIFLYLFAVAIAAYTNEIQHPLLMPRVRNKMFLVTVKTGWSAGILHLQKRCSMDACAIILKLYGVTPGAEGRDLLPPCC